MSSTQAFSRLPSESSCTETSSRTRESRSVDIESRKAVVSSRDEMNLAEFPLTVLSTRVNPNVKTLEFTDFQRLKSGELLERKWIITGADKFGLPTSSDDDVVLGLIRLTMDQGFRDPKVFFTRYELLKILRWTTEGRSYARLTKSLDRLSGVRIRASNAFFDNSSKSYQTRNFGIIDAYEINGSRTAGGCLCDDAKSYFVWSDTLFESFKAGFIKKLDLDLYFSLRSAVSRRLYRYLDKHFYYKGVVEKNLMALAFEKLGVSRNYKYVSSIKQQIEPGARELVEVGFLESFDFLGCGSDTVARFIQKRHTAGHVTCGDHVSARPVAGPSRESGHSKPTADVLRAQIIEMLVSRGVGLTQSIGLLADKTDAICSKLLAIISYYDYLLTSDDKRISKNPVGFLFRAIESPERFQVPDWFLGKQRASANIPANARGRRDVASRPELRVVRASRNTENTNREASSQRLNQLFPETAGAPTRLHGQRPFDTASRTDSGSQCARLQVERKLSFLRGVLDDNQFEEAVNKCLKEQFIE